MNAIPVDIPYATRNRTAVLLFGDDRKRRARLANMVGGGVDASWQARRSLPLPADWPCRKLTRRWWLIFARMAEPPWMGCSCS